MGADAHYLPCDLAVESSVRSFASQIRRLCSDGIDVLVNNAGINGESHLVADMPLQRWERVLRANLTGTMLVMRELIPLLMARGGGQIVNISSNAARRRLPFRADYVWSKWALLGLTQTLALELVKHNIRVNAVRPGPVEGYRIEQVMRGHASAERQDQGGGPAGGGIGSADGSLRPTDRGGLGRPLPLR